MKAYHLLAIYLLVSIHVAAQQETAKEVEFPTIDEIQLVLSQSERSIEQYRRAVVLESELVSAKEDPSGVRKDQGVIESATKLIAALNKNPKDFTGWEGCSCYPYWMMHPVMRRCARMRASQRSRRDYFPNQMPILSFATNRVKLGGNS